MTSEVLLIWSNNSNFEQANWYFFADNKIQSNGKELATISAEFKSAKTTWLISSEDILLTNVLLPNIAKNKIKLALPFALEEQLIADIGELHFVLGKQQVDNQWPVVIIAKQKMTELLAIANKYQLFPAEVIPDIFTLPAHEKHWYALINEKRCIVRTGEYSGFTVERSQFSLLLTSACKEAKINPECIHLLFTGKDQKLDLPELTNSTFNNTEINSDKLISEVIATLIAFPSINLLQGNLQSHQSTASTRKIWQSASLLVVAWLGVLFSTHLANIFILQHQDQKLMHSIRSIYNRYFPLSTNMVAPKLRLKEKLANLHMDNQQNIFLPLLAVTGEIIAKNNNIKLEQIDFHNKILRVKLSANSFDLLDVANNQLKKAGLSVKQQAATATDSHVQASFLIQRS